MEKIYNVFRNLKNPDHRLTRKDYLLTLLIYNILVSCFVAITMGGINLIARQGLDTSEIAAPLSFVLCLPLYTSHYHRLLDTGMPKNFAKLIPFIGFILKSIGVFLTFATDYYTAGFFGTETLTLFGGLYLDPDAKFYTFTATFLLIQALYMFINLILVLTKTDQLKSKKQ